MLLLLNSRETILLTTFVLAIFSLQCDFLVITNEKPGAERPSVWDVGGKQMCCLRRRVGQGCSLLLMLPVGTGQPLIVLPQMLFPGKNEKAFHEAVCRLAIAIEPHSTAPVRNRDRRTQLIAWRNDCSFSSAMV